MLQGCKVTKTSPVLLAHIQPHTSKDFCSDRAWWETTITLPPSVFFVPSQLQRCRENCGFTEHVVQNLVPLSRHGVYHRWRNRWGESVDWRAVSRTTVNSFRQNIKVLQQLLRAQRLKSEQRQAHRELLLLPGKQILLWVPCVHRAFSLWSSQINTIDIFYFFAL